MASYFLYKNSKKWFIDQINANKDPFVLPNVKGWGDEVTFFTACLRGALKVEKNEADLDKSGMFKPDSALTAIRLDTKQEIKTNKNILYRLALKYKDFTDFSYKSGAQTKSLTTKSDFIRAATSPAKIDASLIEKKEGFEKFEIFTPSIDAVTYECVTKQAFYRWHKKNFIDNTALKKTIKEKDWADKSVLGWTKVDVSNGPKFFIDPDGGPFNSGFPTICVIMEQGYPATGNDSMKAIFDKQAEILKSTSDLIGNAFGRVLDKPDSFLVYPFNRDNATSPKSIPFIVQPSLRPNVNKAKICVGFDYTKLVLNAQAPSSEVAKLDAVKVGLNYFMNGPAEGQKGVSVSFTTDDKFDAFDRISDAVDDTKKILHKLRKPLHRAPPFYIKKDKIGIFAKEMDDYRYDNEKLATRGMKKRQYRIDALRINQGMRSLYDIDGLLADAYEKQRNTDPQFKKYDSIEAMDKKDLSANETITFLYDEYRNLLAVSAKRNLSKKELKAASSKSKEENNSIPFDVLPFYGGKYAIQASDIKKLESFVDRIKGKKNLNQGLDGDIAFVTDIFVKRFKEQYDKIIPNPTEYAQNIYDVSRKDIVEAQLKSAGLFKDDKLNSIFPAVVPYKHLTEALVEPVRRNKFLLSKSINNFFIFSRQLKKEIEGPSLKILKTEIWGSKDPAKQKRGELFAATLQTLIDNYHYPPLDIKPSAKKDGEELPTKDPEKKKVENAPGSKKVVDVDSYNNAYKAYAKEILLVDAQASQYACFNDLAEVLAGPGDPLVNLADFLFTKFPWRQLLMELIQDQTRKLKERAASADAADALACIEDIDKLNATFLRLKNAFLNFDGIVDAILPDMPTFADVPYIPILDFNEQAKKKIVQSIVDALVAGLKQMIGSSMEKILKACNDYDSFQAATQIGDKNASATGKSQQNSNVVPVGDQAGQLPGYGDSSKANMINVSIVELLRMSGIDTLENVYNKIKNEFDLRDKKTAELITNDFLTEYFDAVSETIDATELRSLLVGVSIDEVINLVIDVVKYSNVYSRNSQNILIDVTQKPIVDSFESKTSVVLLFELLSHYVNLDLIDQQIASGAVIVPDPCFKDIGDITDILLDDLKKKGFNSKDSASILRNETDEINDLVGRLCEALESAEEDILKKADISLISDQAKKDMSAGVSMAIAPVQSLQTGVKMHTSNLFKSTFADLINFFNGVPEPKPPAPQLHALMTEGLHAHPLAVQQVGSPPKEFLLPNPLFNQHNLILDEAQKSFIKKAYDKLLAFDTFATIPWSPPDGPQKAIIKSGPIAYEINFGKEKMTIEKKSSGVLVRTIILPKKLNSENNELKTAGRLAGVGKTLDTFQKFYVDNVWRFGGKSAALKETMLLEPPKAAAAPSDLFNKALGSTTKVWNEDRNDGDFMGKEIGIVYNTHIGDLAAALPANLKNGITAKQAEEAFVKNLFDTINSQKVLWAAPGPRWGNDLKNPTILSAFITAFVEDPKTLQKKYIDSFNDLLDESGTDVSGDLDNLMAYKTIIKTLEGATPSDVGKLGTFKINTILSWPTPSKKVYWFTGDSYFRYDRVANDNKGAFEATAANGAKYPLLVKNHWNAKLADAVPFDAAFYYQGKIYFFKGKDYWGYDSTKKESEAVDAWSPLKIKDEWPGPAVGGPNLPDNIDAAFYWPKGLGKSGPDDALFVFKGDKYWKYKDGKIDAMYPIEIKNGWPGMPDNIDAAFVWEERKAIYFFKGDEYWKWMMADDKPAIGYPLNIFAEWDVPGSEEFAEQKVTDKINDIHNAILKIVVSETTTEYGATSADMQALYAVADPAIWSDTERQIACAEHWWLLKQWGHYSMLQDAHPGMAYLIAHAIADRIESIFSCAKKT